MRTRGSIAIVSALMASTLIVSALGMSAPAAPLAATDPLDARDARQGGDARVFRVETRLVVLYATVRNARGEPVTNLDREAFRVYENGAPQTIALFRRDDIPVSFGLLIDNSGSMRTERATVESAALACVRASNPRDEVFVLNFADKARVDVPMTSDPRVLEAGIARIDAIGGTALRDAIDVGSTYLIDRAARDRRVLLVITDGKDNASTATFDRIRRRAEQQEIAVYAIVLPNAREGSAASARHELDDLAALTGGAVHYPASLAQLADAAIAIAQQIRQQYTIAYTPTNTRLDGSYRSIRVTVRGRDRLVVRTRAGYRAAPAPKATNEP